MNDTATAPQLAPLKLPAADLAALAALREQWS